MSRALSLPRARSELEGGGGRDMAGPIFLPLGGRISTAQVSYDLHFRIFGTFCRLSQKGIIVGGSPEAKNIEKTLL